MMNENALIVPMMGGLVTLGGVIVGLLVNAQRERRKLAVATESRLMALETQMTPFWGAFQKEVAAALHHPHPESQELDSLLELLEKRELSHIQRDRLTALLRQKADDKNQSEKERTRAQLLMVAMPLVVKEEKATAEAGAAAAASV
jgi:hypothetical protein